MTARLIALLADRSAKRGDFVLASGRRSTLYGEGGMVRSFTVRKEAKQHGTGKLIEGAFVPGDKVVVVEDVITTGGSALKAVQAIRAAGGDILGVLALVDRQEGGREALEAAGLEVLSLVTAEQLVPLIGG